MIDGECTTQKVLLIPANPVPSSNVANIPVNPLPGCCSDFVIKVLADASGNALQNDVNTVVHWFEPIVTGASMVLKKWVNGAWADQAAITSSNYGTFNAFGYYVNNEDQNFISLKIEWSKVLALLGEGNYKVTTSYTVPIFGDQTVDSYEFCLQTYTPQLADGTVRLEYWLSGTTGDIEDDTKIKDFGTLSVYNSLRVKGFFGYPKSNYKEEDIQYGNGQSVYVEDEQLPAYKCKLLLLPFFIHEILRTDFMMADTLAVTDYNSKNNAFFVQKFVRKDSGYDPKWYELQSNLATVELQFKPQFNRTRKLR
jgi:hypothetical protein